MSLPNGITSDELFESTMDRTEVVGQGTSRCVYGVRGTKDFVIKESKGPFHQSNFVEWIVWNAVTKMKDDIMGSEPNYELGNLFAGCFAISHSARYLMMERLNPISTRKDIPLNKFLRWLNDKKPSAFGAAADGTVKVMDYGIVDFYWALNPKNMTSPF